MRTWRSGSVTTVNLQPVGERGALAEAGGAFTVGIWRHSPRSSRTIRTRPEVSSTPIVRAAPGTTHCASVAASDIVLPSNAQTKTRPVASRSAA
jgi:hypothetical protein